MECAAGHEKTICQLIAIFKTIGKKANEDISRTLQFSPAFFFQHLTFSFRLLAFSLRL
jgi:hypothetical protein